MFIQVDTRKVPTYLSCISSNILRICFMIKYLQTLSHYLWRKIKLLKTFRCLGMKPVGMYLYCELTISGKKYGFVNLNSCRRSGNI